MLTLQDESLVEGRCLPYCVGLIAILVIGWSSDRTRERRWHTALCMVAASIGLLAGIALRDQLTVAVALFCFAAVGMYGYLPGFWALPTSFLSGTAAAASIGLINSVGNLGGFVGPSVVGYVSKATNSFFGGVLYLSFTSLVAAFLVLSIRATRRRPASDKLEFVASVSEPPAVAGGP